MFKRFAIIALLLAVFNFCGCVSVRPVNLDRTESSHVYHKNYNAGIERTAYVGEEIVKIKDYYVLKQNLSKVQADSDFSVSVFGNGTYHGNKGDQYSLLGELDDDGVNKYLIGIPGMPLIRFCIDKDGNMTDKLIGNLNQVLVLSPQLNPNSTKFRLVRVEQVDRDAGYVNFEIVFTGTTDKSINLLYREYTKENLAREAFFQNLTYPITAKQIRFKNVLISVAEVAEDHMRYTVIADGLTQ